ncbi:hypothetical protein [Sphingomonas sp. PP-CE-1G-424]|uniref:hypothetical protein n=1 Tax=Sphingomonas sp. PP-CE-1G-424 TaxID=2135658 RepID=UPI001056705B|nr:hypothetical protein [Sphingomonas sp. PP-CE-1G-424]TCP67922.1 hypothetical protein C8J43_103566 [Sphingomonas sp. PP-CE-1G-424]
MIRAPLLPGIVAAAVFATGCSAQPRAASAGMPADVRAFVAKRTQCDHFRGEEPYDAARAADLDRRMRATCTGTDATLARLKRAHHRDRTAMQALSAYDARIE